MSENGIGIGTFAMGEIGQPSISSSNPDEDLPIIKKFKTEVSAFRASHPTCLAPATAPASPIQLS